MRILITVICFLMTGFYSIAEENMDTDFQTQINEILSQLVQKDNRLVNVTNRIGNTALNLLVKSDNVEAIRELISAGADVNKANDEGDTPLISLACYNSTTYNVEIAAILMDNGADINAQEDVNNLTALHCAIMEQQIPLVLFLLDQEGVDLFLADDDGDTALHMLAYVGIIGINSNIEGMDQEEIIEHLKSLIEGHDAFDEDSSEPVFQNI